MNLNYVLYPEKILLFAICIKCTQKTYTDCITEGNKCGCVAANETGSSDNAFAATIDLNMQYNINLFIT